MILLLRWFPRKTPRFGATALVFSIATLSGCGGTVASGPADAGSKPEAGGGTDAGFSDARGFDAAAFCDADPVPSHVEYQCSPLPPDGGPGCDGYPEGCMEVLPMLAGDCGGSCCGPQICICESGPMGGLQWECPI